MIVWSELKCTHSKVLSKDGKPFVAVMFERGEDVAEGQVPECVIQRSKGFTEEEVRELEAYLEDQRREIVAAARKISSLKNFFS